MALTLNGTTNTISGLAVGGLPDGIVDTDMLAANAVTAAKATGGRSLLDADHWRIHTTLTTDASYLTANWERTDVHFDKIGSGMTESSGVFTFPSTGIWLITYHGGAHSQNVQRFIGATIYTSIDNGSNWSEVAENATCTLDDGSYWFYAAFSTDYIFDVTDTSNCKVKFKVSSTNQANFHGTSTKHMNGATFIRLGDT